MLASHYLINFNLRTSKVYLSIKHLGVTVLMSSGLVTGWGIRLAIARVRIVRD